MMNTDELARIVMRAIIALGNQRREYSHDDGEYIESGSDNVCLFCDAEGHYGDDIKHDDDCLVNVAKYWMGMIEFLDDIRLKPGDKNDDAQ